MYLQINLRDDITNNAISASGDYGKYAFSADGNFANYRTDKDAFNFANAWKNSDGALWIMRISGGSFKEHYQDHTGLLNVKPEF